LSFPEFNLEVSDEEGKPFGEFFTELPTRDTTLPFGRDPRLLSDVLAIISPLLLFARLCPDSRWVVARGSLTDFCISAGQF